MDIAANTKESQSNKDVERPKVRRKKKEKLYKVKRSSGETHLLTKEQIRELNEAKRKRHNTKKYLKLITFVFGIFITVFGAQLITKDFIKKYKGSSSELTQDLSDQLIPTVVSSEDEQTRLKSLIGDENETRVNNSNRTNLELKQDKEIDQTKVARSRRETEYTPPKFTQRDKTPTNILSVISPTKLSIIQAPEETITTSEAHFVFEANKPVAFSYMLEGYDSNYSDFLSVRSKSYSNLPDGSYTFHLRAKDKNGKITEPIFRRFSIDTTPPDIKIIEAPDGTVAERNIIFRFSADDDTTRRYISSSTTFATYLQGYDKQFSEYTENTIRSYNNLPDGDYTFQVKAKDKYGNESLNPVIRSFTVDAEAPGAKIVEGPGSIISEKSVVFKFSANGEATFAYQLKGRDSGYSDFISDNSVTYNELPDGEYVFFVKAKDKSGNVDSEPAKLKFTIDTKPPNTSIMRGPNDLIKYSTVSFSFKADEKVTFSYYLEGYNDEYSGYTSESSKTYHNLPDRSYTFAVRSKDLAGNVDEKGASLTFVIKTKELLFTEDFEDKELKIEAGDLKDRKVYWGLTKKRAKSGERSLWCAKTKNKDQTYSKDMNAWYKILVDLSRFDRAEIVFWYYLDTTNDIADRLYLKAISQSKAKDKDIEQSKPIWYASVKKDKQLKWVKQRIPLDRVCGQPAVIMIFFKSDDKFEDEGAYIDDISIIGKY